MTCPVLYIHEYIMQSSDRDEDLDGLDVESDYESDWEAEINSKGEVFYIQPVSEFPTISSITPQITNR